MGNWNETCGLSRLPILLRDRVVCFITMKRNVPYANMGNLLLPDEHYTVLGLPIRGRHDEYGGIEDVECSDNCKNFFLGLDYHMSGYEDEESQFTIYKPADTEELIHNISYGNMHVCMDAETSAPLQIYMVHEELYELLINTSGNRQQAYDKILARAEDINKIEKELPGRSFEDIVSKFSMSAFGFECDKPFPNIFDYMADSICHKKDEESIRDAVEIMLFKKAMSSSRNAFFGYCGRGSQSEDTHCQKVIGEFIIKHVKELAKRCW